MVLISGATKSFNSKLGSVWKAESFLLFFSALSQMDVMGDLEVHFLLLEDHIPIGAWVSRKSPVMCTNNAGFTLITVWLLCMCRACVLQIVTHIEYCDKAGPAEDLAPQMAHREKEALMGILIFPGSVKQNSLSLCINILFNLPVVPLFSLCFSFFGFASQVSIGWWVDFL